MKRNYLLKSIWIIAFSSATALMSPAQTFTTLVNFNGANGAYPLPNGLVQGFDGNLYGTTQTGGTANLGTAFKMTPTGSLTTLHSFCAATACHDGSTPGAIVLGMDGNFYGNASGGGSFGSGTIFRLTAAGSLSTIHNFDGTDGFGGGDLLQLNRGGFEGTTTFGGTGTHCFGAGCGTIFRLTPSGNLTTLYDFCTQANCPDGEVLFDSVIEDNTGNFWGVTFAGGTGNSGTIFKLAPGNQLTTVYSFCQNYPFCSNGGGPIGIVMGRDGNFYGTTISSVFDEGTVFKITPAGVLTTLYFFCVQTACADGSYPRSGLALGSDGNFYGTTSFGGAHNEGTLFEITPAGVLTTLHSFDGEDGNFPIGSLSQAPNGLFYGTTTAGGSGAAGTVFSLDTGLAPFVETLPTAGSRGTAVTILGTDLTGAIGVTFNGTAAKFSVVSSTEIKTAVPAGATNGTVEVTMPSRTLNSNVVFTITK